METRHRTLVPGERLQKGDQWQDGNNWRASTGYCVGACVGDLGFGFNYRRPINVGWYPSYKCNQVPQVPVHVAWAESPASVVLTDRDAVAAEPGASIDVGDGYRLLAPEEIVARGDDWQLSDGKWLKATGTVGLTVRAAGFEYRRKLPTPPPATIDVGPGYRLLGDDEKWENGDEFIYKWLLSRGAWYEMCALNWGQSTRIWNDKPENEGEMWKIVARRKITKASAYRPFANAAEAARALEGKLIRHKVTTTHLAVSMVTRDKVVVGEDDVSFEGLRTYWKFTDGTPCGVLVTENEGK